MYDPALRVGRHGYEVQYTLLVHPDHLVFDPETKKLGTVLDPVRSGLADAPPPPGWRWTADPVRARNYLPDGEAIPEAMAGFFLTDHHERLAGSLGYETLHLYRDRVCFQLELVSDPMGSDATEARFADAIRVLYEEGLAGLIQRGVVGSYTPERQHRIKEQISLEIDDVRWPRRVDPLRKLGWLGLGAWALARYHRGLTGLDEHLAGLAAWLDEITLQSARSRTRYDLLGNVRLLVEGYLHGAGWPEPLSCGRLAAILGSPAHVAVLAGSWDNDECPFYVHGVADLEVEALRRLSPRDFRLFRQLGIDSVFLDLFAGRPSEHLSEDRTRLLDFHRQGLARFCDMETIRRTVVACLDGEDAPVDRIALPLFHLRKTLTPGCTYVELRDVHGLKFRGLPRYPAQFLMVGDPEQPLNVVYFGHGWKLAHDLARLFDVCILAGAELARDLQDRSSALARRDPVGVERRVTGLLEWIGGSYVRLSPVPSEPANDQ